MSVCVLLMPNEPIFTYTTYPEKGEDCVEIKIFPSGIKIYQNGSFRFIVPENDILKEISEKELFERVIK